MNKYKTGEKIGDGGFAEVWKCHRMLDERVFAKKILLSNDLESRRRFGREIKILTKLNHPNIIKIYDFELDLHRRYLLDLESNDNEEDSNYLGSRDYDDRKFHSNSSVLNYENSFIISRFLRFIGFLFEYQPYRRPKTSFIIMPYYQNSLNDVIDTVVGNEDAIGNIYSSILNAMKYAHSNEVIHRDLHPQNILLNSHKDVVVTDFGIGRQIDSSTPRVTSTGDSLGVFPFIAEEQMKDMKRAGKPADVHSLGMLLYYLHTGRTSPIIQLSISDPVFEVICKCLKHEPAARYEDAKELYQAWEEAIGKNTVKAQDL